MAGSKKQDRSLTLIKLYKLYGEIYFDVRTTTTREVEQARKTYTINKKKIIYYFWRTASFHRDAEVIMKMA